MSINSKDLEEWAMHPVTLDIKRRVKQAVEDRLVDFSANGSMEDIAIRSIYRSGFIDGVKAFNEEYLNE